MSEALWFQGLATIAQASCHQPEVLGMGSHLLGKETESRGRQHSRLNSIFPFLIPIHIDCLGTEFLSFEGTGVLLMPESHHKLGQS